jgi:hypothetical protein
MPSIEQQDYKGHAIVAMATPAGSGRYHSIFSVHASEQSDDAGHVPLAHQESVADSPSFATEAEAIDAAHGRARAWIDMQTR